MRFYALSNVTAFINDVEMFQKEGDYLKKERTGYVTIPTKRWHL